MRIELKNGVKVKGVKPELLFALMAIDSVFRERGVEMVVTSITDGKHMQGSLHYVGMAADIRLPPLSLTQYILRQMRMSLGGNPDDNRVGEYDVVLENDHIHVEYDPD